MASCLTVLAGIPSGEGTANGEGTAARFVQPQGIAIDGAGNIIVADAADQTIRRITPAGAVTTLVNKGVFPSGFVAPSSVAVDGAGNVIVADSGSDSIRKISPDGVVTTLAGTPFSQGSADGTGNAARFFKPEGVAVDGAGNIIVADTFNHTIRKITPDGVVTTIAGKAGLHGGTSGTLTYARFSMPSGVAVDGAGNILVADRGNHTIRKISPDGMVTTLAGAAGWFGSADGTEDTARFVAPESVAMDGAGNVIVADTGNNTLRKVAPNGVVTTFAGRADACGSEDGMGAAARFCWPRGVAVDRAGNIFVADSLNRTIRKIAPDGTVESLAGVSGASGSADGAGTTSLFDAPMGVVVDGLGNVLVADSDNHTIRKVASGGVVTTLAGKAGSLGDEDGTGAAARFHRPQGLAVDAAGNVFVADTNNDTIRKVTQSGVVTPLVKRSRLSQPKGVAVDGAGNVFASDGVGNVIWKITLG